MQAGGQAAGGLGCINKSRVGGEEERGGWMLRAQEGEVRGRRQEEEEEEEETGIREYE